MHQLQKITDREKEVLVLISQEYETRAIAEMLFLSPHTVMTHRKNILKKLKVKNTAGMIRRAFEQGILKVDQPAVIERQFPIKLRSVI